MEVKKELLIKIKEYIEDCQETIDGEWGSGRKTEQLIKDNAMPEIYDEIIKLLSEPKQ